jgi:predicted amidophosphoribosyltransferase
MDGLFKKVDTLPQIGLSAKERTKNLRGAFVATRQFRGNRVLLVDDVMTTGATASECSKQLIEAGASEVVVLTLARAAAL